MASAMYCLTNGAIRAGRSSTIVSLRLLTPGSYYDDPSDRVLNGPSYCDDSGMRQESCIEFCDAKGYPLAGVEFGSVSLSSFRRVLEKWHSVAIPSNVCSVRSWLTTPHPSRPLVGIFSGTYR